MALLRFALELIRFSLLHPFFIAEWIHFFLLLCCVQMYSCCGNSFYLDCQFFFIFSCFLAHLMHLLRLRWNGVKLNFDFKWESRVRCTIYRCMIHIKCYCARLFHIDCSVFAMAFSAILVGKTNVAIPILLLSVPRGLDALLINYRLLCANISISSGLHVSDLH